MWCKHCRKSPPSRLTHQWSLRQLTSSLCWPTQLQLMLKPRTNVATIKAMQIGFRRWVSTYRCQRHGGEAFFCWNHHHHILDSRGVLLHPSSAPRPTQLHPPPLQLPSSPYPPLQPLRRSSHLPPQRHQKPRGERGRPANICVALLPWIFRRLRST